MRDSVKDFESSSTEDRVTAEAAPEANRLRSAMERADTHIENTGETKSEVLDVHLEHQLAEYLADELAMTDTPPLDIAEEEEMEEPEFVTTIEEDKPAKSENSAKIIEIHEKQGTLQSMTARIRENCDALSSVSKQTEQMIAYLERTEDDLIRLEENDVKLTKLTKAFQDLAHKYKKVQMMVAEQQKSITLLEGQNKSSHEVLESKKLELAGFEDENANLTQQLNERDLICEKLLSEKQAQSERIDLLIEEQEAKVSELQKTTKLLNAAQQKNREHELLGAKNKRTISELTQQGDKRIAEINELGARFDSLRERMVERESELDILKQESASTQKELEEKLRLKQLRCQELESKMIMTEKQLAQTEGRLTTLTFDLETTKRINSRTASDPASVRAKKKDGNGDAEASESQADAA